MEKLLKTPWTYSKQNGIPGHCIVAQIFDCDGKALGQVEPKVRQDIVNEQVKLMAAAPDLLEAHKAMLSRFNGTDVGHVKADYVKDLARKAINKATK